MVYVLFALSAVFFRRMQRTVRLVRKLVGSVEAAAGVRGVLLALVLLF